jgi:hypothetical protein
MICDHLWKWPGHVGTLRDRESGAVAELAILEGALNVVPTPGAL